MKNSAAGSSQNDATRKAPTENQNIELISQVDNVCPICSRPLLDKSGDQRFKRFEIAHIYPLNPTPLEQTLLANEEILSPDRNDLANLIPLCKNCHGEFDKPRTLEGYRRLVECKRQVMKREDERSLWHRYPLENAIKSVVERLSEQEEDSPDKTNLEVKPVDFKTEGAPPLTRNKIRMEVRRYFSSVQQFFVQIERTKPGSSELVAHQVRSYYLAQKQLCADKQELYYRIARWIQRKTNGSSEAAEIVTSFFVQNCEVFG